MSEHNITVEGGSSVRLKTAGKYCDRDIVVTSTGGEVVEPIIEPLDVTENGTYIPSDDIDGYNPVTVNVPLRYDEGYNDGFSEGKKDGYNEGYQASQDSIIYQEKTVEIAENGTTEVLPDEGKTLSKVTVNVDVESGGGNDMAGALSARTITEFSSDSCTAIGEYAFRGCESLTTLVAPNAKSVGTYALYGCSKLKSIVLPSVTTVAANSFREASNLEIIDLPKLTAIPATAFYGCRGIEALILRSETMVTLANTNAFTQCYRILGTKNSGYNPTGEKIGFFYVPKALIEDYRAATNWSDATIVTQFRAIEDYPEITGGVV